MIVRPLNSLVLLLLASTSRAAVAATALLVEPSTGPLTVLPPLPTDDCAIPTVIAGSGPFAFDTTLATTGPQGQAEAVCLLGSTAIEDDVWFAWTAPSTGFFAVETCAGTAMDSKIAVYDGTGCPAASALACNDDFCGLQTRTVFVATAGSSYTIQLGSFPGAGGGTGTFTITPTPVGVPPANDAACSATPINEFEDQRPVDSTNATTNALEGAACASIPMGGQLQADVWYCWSNNTTDPYHFTLSRCQSSPPADTMPSPGIILYSTNSCAPPLCNPVSPVCGSSCSATEFCFTPTAIGQMYLLRIGSVTGSGTAGGVAYLTIESGCPDECQTKGKITGTNFKTFDTGETTTGTEGQNNTGCYVPPGMDDDAWYDWLATQTGSVLVSTCGFTTVDTRIVVYAGTACPPGTALACNDDFCGPQSQVCFLATAGTHYTIQVGKTPGTPDGSVTFLVTELPPTTSCSSLSGFAYCAGDGIDLLVTTPCPCLNFGSVGRGCASSFNASGASLTASGTIALDNVALDGAGMNATGTCIFLKGSADIPSGVVFGDGVRCLSGALIRLRTKALVGGTAAFPDATDTVTLSARSGTTIGSGVNAYYGVYYRNAAAAFCPPATFNISNGWFITW